MATDSILRPGELKEILLKEIQAADLAELDVREVARPTTSALTLRIPHSALMFSTSSFL